MIALLLYVLYLVLKKLLTVFNCFVKSMLYLGIEINWEPIMIFELVRCILNHLFRVSDYLIELFDPFGDNSKNRRRFYEKDTILNFSLSILWGVFTNLPSYQKFSIWFDFLIIHLRFITLCIFNYIFSFMNRDKNLSKYICEYLFELIVFVITSFYHKVNCFHNLLSIISIIFFSKINYFRLRYFAD